MTRIACLLLITATAASGSPAGRLADGIAAPDDAGCRSPVHVCLAPDGRYAYVVNQTADTVSVLDLEARKVLREIPVGAFPTHAAVSSDGATLFVTCQFEACVQALDLRAGAAAVTLPTGNEPRGLALSRDGTRLFVAESLDDSVALLDADSGRLLHRARVGRQPRYLAETPDGRRLVVGGSLARSVSIVDVETGRVVETRSLGRASLLRQVACSADGRWAFVAHVLSHDEVSALQMERGWIHSNGFSVLDLGQRGRRVTLLLDRLLKGAANPWGLVLSPGGERLFITLAGVHEVAIVDLPALLKIVAATPPEKVEALERDVEILAARGIARRVPAGGLGPRGLALDAARNELLVCNYFSDSVSVLDARSGAILAVIQLGESCEQDLWRRGELLFNDARLCFQQWFSCASCHEEDGVVDGLNWDLPNDGLGNPKNVKSLHDAADTPPAMWTGVRSGMEAAVAAGQRFLGFLPDPENHAALLEYVGAPRRRPNPWRSRDPARRERGQLLFTRARCNACHPPPAFCDGRVHDLGLSGPSDLRSRFDTPSLRECYRTAPYLHDGRAATLEEVFTRHNPEDLHGLTGGLSASELADLLAFVRSL